MTDGPDIGGRSRRFQAAVILVTMLALLAGALAAATLSGGGSLVDIDLGDGGGSGEAGEGGVDGGAGSGGSGGDGAGLGLPEFLVDIFDWFGESGSGEGEPVPVDPGEADIPPPPYDITLEPEPTPGRPVVVTVEKDGTPVPFVVVTFDGDPVGRTSPTGQLRARVPYTDELTVTAVPPAETGGGSLGAPALSGRLGAPAGGTQAGDAGNSSVTYDVPTDISARVDGVALPGETATVRFTVSGTPVPGVDVRRDGEREGITDENGTVEIAVPADTPLGGSVPVSLTRDEFAGEAGVEVGNLVASVETGLFALPATSGTVEVKAVDSTDTEPLGGVPVTVTDGGEQVAAGETGENGTMSVTLPWSNSVTATATTDHGTVSTTVDWLFLHLVGVVVALVVPVAGLVVWTTRNPATRRRARERLVGLLLAAGTVLESTARRLAAALGRVPVVGAVTWLRDLLGRTADGLVSAAGRLGAGLASVAAGLREGAWLGFVLAGPRWLLGRLRAGLSWLRELFSRPSENNGERRAESETKAGSTPSGEETGERTDRGPRPAEDRLRRCWRWLVRRVVGGRARTKTPAEIERRAVDRGLPAGAVRRLRRAFQDVEYGPADAEERVDDAESAHETLTEGEQ